MQKKQYGKKCRKCNLSGEMLQTHYAAMSSTHFRNLRSQQKSYKLNETQKTQEAQDRQQTHDAISSTALCDSRSPL